MEVGKYWILLAVKEGLTTTSENFTSYSDTSKVNLVFIYSVGPIFCMTIYSIEKPSYTELLFLSLLLGIIYFVCDIAGGFYPPLWVICLRKSMLFVSFTRSNRYFLVGRNVANNSSFEFSLISPPYFIFNIFGNTQLTILVTWWIWFSLIIDFPDKLIWNVLVSDFPNMILQSSLIWICNFIEYSSIRTNSFFERFCYLTNVKFFY